MSKTIFSEYEQYSPASSQYSIQKFYNQIKIMTEMPCITAIHSITLDQSQFNKLVFQMKRKNQNKKQVEEYQKQILRIIPRVESESISGEIESSLFCNQNNKEFPLYFRSSKRFILTPFLEQLENQKINDACKIMEKRRKGNQSLFILKDQNLLEDLFQYYIEINLFYPNNEIRKKFKILPEHKEEIQKQLKKFLQSLQRIQKK